MTLLGKWYGFITLVALALLCAYADYLAYAVVFALIALAVGLKNLDLWQRFTAGRPFTIERTSSTVTVTENGETTRYRSTNGFRFFRDEEGMRVSDWDERPLEPLS